MAANPPAGDGHRNGAMRGHSQVFNPVIQRWTQRDMGTGRCMDQKVDGKPIKGSAKRKLVLDEEHTLYVPLKKLS